MIDSVSFGVTTHLRFLFMKMLYVAAGHPLQCADHILMWERLGIKWFSTAYYCDTDKPGDLPYIKRNLNLDSKLVDNFKTIGKTHKEPIILVRKNANFGGKNYPNLFKFSERFLKNFDMFFVGHNISNLDSIVKYINPKKNLVVMNTFGMHAEHHEERLKKHSDNGVKIVRNSPKEHLIYPKFAGYDEIIRGSVIKDENEISGWTGELPQVVTFTNTFYLPTDRSSIKRRGKYLEIRDKCQGIPFILHGSSNEKDPLKLSQGILPHSEKVELLQKSRINLVTGTPGANNTYSMVESWIMGMPTVVFGREMWPGTGYEPDELITHGQDGFIVHSTDEAADTIRMLMNDHELCKKIGMSGREKAISIYGRNVLAEKWKQFFQNSLI